MTFDEAAATFGGSFPVRYMDSTGVYHDSIATLQSNHNTQYKISNLNGFVDSQGYLQVNRRFLQYSFSVSGSLNQQPQNLTLFIQPEYQIFDTEYIYTAIAVSSGSSGASTNVSAYNSPSWDWVWSGQSVNFSPSLLAQNNVLPRLNFFEEGYTVFDFVPAYMDSQAVTSGYSVSSTWDKVYAANGKVDILIGLPYVSSNAQGQTGTPSASSTTGSGDINVNVDVDLDQTNGLLEDISAGISGLVGQIMQGLQALFVPTEQQLESWKADMQALLQQHLGGLYDAITVIENFIDNLTSATPSTSIHINALSIPLAGETLTLGPYDVKLKYDDLSLLYDMLALIIDFLCTAAFVNMCRNKLEIVLNPDSEVIQDDS